MLTIFLPTPRMSTYLLAFMVSELKQTISEVDDKFSVWSRPGTEEQTAFALDLGPKLVAKMTDYTGINYYNMHPLGEFFEMKMDQVAIPDFSGGAMENWGLLAYKEAYLLVKDGEISSGFKQRVVTILAHEISHMWFGNLVTCQWWEEAWLNEGFARYFQYYITNMVSIIIIRK
jgi:aminopeptidase N